MARLITSHGGLMATHELHAAGFLREAIAAAVRSRRILRVRQGWYARSDTDRTLLTTARVGGRATCVSGLRLHGVWTPHVTELHVACPAHDARLRCPTDSRIRLSEGDPVRVHWRDLPQRGSRLILTPLECLRDSFTCISAESVAIAGDSVLHTHPDARTRWADFLTTIPATHRRHLAWADGTCESGIETRTWLFLRRLPVRTRRQVPIRGVGRVDFLVGDRLVIEVDGEVYHTDPHQFEDDRRRDARLAALGYRVLRFSYRQVTERWLEVEAAINASIPSAT